MKQEVVFSKKRKENAFVKSMIVHAYPGLIQNKALIIPYKSRINPPQKWFI